METDKIYNLIILDESGSMESIKRPTISGFNEVVQTIKNSMKQFPEQQHFVSFITFNGNGIKTHLDKVPAAQLTAISESTYRPDSMTPLYDAIALSVLKLKIDIAASENTHVLVTIFTDGEENASREFSHQQVQRIIEEQKALGWTFTYIGANHDVEKVARSFSISNTMEFEANEQDVKALFAKESKARERFNLSIRMKDKKQTGYFDDEDAPKMDENA